MQTQHDAALFFYRWEVGTLYFNMYFIGGQPCVHQVIFIYDTALSLTVRVAFIIIIKPQLPVTVFVHAVKNPKL